MTPKVLRKLLAAAAVQEQRDAAERAKIEATARPVVVCARQTIAA